MEKGIRELFESRFAEELDKIRNALPKKYGTKIYDKVIEQLGRLKERYKRVSRHYEITVTKWSIS
jgi:archaellum component FlaC